MNVITENMTPKKHRQYHYVLAEESPHHSEDEDDVMSIQARETDSAKDTSDTDTSSMSDTEYEAVTDVEDPEERRVIHSLCATDTSDTDDEIITTKLIEVSPLDENDLMFADSEESQSPTSDPELERTDYWQCAQCRNTNNNPLYRYCEKCFKVRKNFFPPRPKRKHKNKLDPPNSVQRTKLNENNDNATDSAFCSQELTPTEKLPVIQFENIKVPNSLRINDTITKICAVDKKENSIVSLRNEYIDKAESNIRKRRLLDSNNSDSDIDDNPPKCLKLKTLTQVMRDDYVSPLVKTISDPSINVGKLDMLSSCSSTESLNAKPLSKSIPNGAVLKSLKEKLESSEDNNHCIVCLSEPKSGVFVHGRNAHICCCYKCSLKVWASIKRCPVCNCKVSNVLKTNVI